MKVFKKFNKSGKPCLVCGTRKIKETVLVGRDGTEDGNFMEAEQIHLECLPDLLMKYDLDERRYLFYGSIDEKDLEGW